MHRRDAPKPDVTFPQEKLGGQVETQVGTQRSAIAEYCEPRQPSALGQLLWLLWQPVWTQFRWSRSKSAEVGPASLSTSVAAQIGCVGTLAQSVSFVQTAI
jgi:hypothetical protein